jgi:2-oxoglutarate ferredoxin oxidoreductase subunit alpha
MIGADLPAVIVNVQRGGPGLGGIQPSQADYWMATRAPGHGDGQVLVFAPSSVQEMADLVARAFDLGDRYRMPAMILADGLLGQMMEPVKLPEAIEPGDLPEKDWACSGRHGRKAHNIANSLSMVAQKREDMVLERNKRYELIKETEQMHQAELVEDADLVLVAFGAAARICRSAMKMARAEGLKVGLIRPITLWPFPVDAVRAAAERGSALLSVEFSTGQMVDDVRLAVNGKVPVSFFGHAGGVVPEPAEVLEACRRAIAAAETGEQLDLLPFHEKLKAAA